MMAFNMKIICIKKEPKVKITDPDFYLFLKAITNIYIWDVYIWKMHF